MPVGSDVEFSLSANDPTYDFSGRPQQFVALKIPDGFRATTLQVRSYLSTSFLPMASAVLPEFLFLDADYQVLAKKLTENFQNAAGFWRSALTGRTDVPSEARYVVVTAGDGISDLPIVQAASGRGYRVKPAALGDFSLRLFGESK